MNDYIKYGNGDIYNGKVVTRVFTTKHMNPRRKNRLGHYVCWENRGNNTSGICTLSRFGLNHPMHKKAEREGESIVEVAPWMVSWFKDPDIPLTHTIFSKRKVDLICPYCGMDVKDKVIANIYCSGKVPCSNCSDGISYPERFISNLFATCGIDFKFHKTFPWSNGREYDFYIESLNMIIEAHGRQHYTNTWSNGVDKKSIMSIQDIDAYKKDMAIQNNVQHYVVLDCQKSDYEYIKNSIITSILSHYFDFSEVDWRLIGEKSIKSVLSNVIDAYKSNMCKEDVLSKFKISDYTYYRYLKRARKLGLIVELVKRPRKPYRKTHKHHTTYDNPYGLTGREVDVCALAVHSLEFKQIANILGVAYTTVVEHKKNAYKKLNIHSKEELMQLYNSSEALKILLDNTNVCHDRSETVTII